MSHSQQALVSHQRILADAALLPERCLHTHRTAGASRQPAAGTQTSSHMIKTLRGRLQPWHAHKWYLSIKGLTEKSRGYIVNYTPLGWERGADLLGCPGQPVPALRQQQGSSARTPALALHCSQNPS